MMRRGEEMEVEEENRKEIEPFVSKQHNFKIIQEN
jgi:hypothetical protein